MALEITVDAAKNDPLKREIFIEEHMAFVVFATSGASGRYISTTNDIEFNIGLEALNDAIDSYDETIGKFETYAGTVIKNRVIDYLRKENRETYSLLEDRAYETIEDTSSSLDAKIEISELTRTLNTFGIEFDDLVEMSPKHRDSRERAIKLGMGISDSREVMGLIYEKLKLPVAMIVKRFRESRRFVYLHNNYILTVALIFDKEYEYIKTWILEVMGGVYNDIE